MVATLHVRIDPVACTVPSQSFERLGNFFTAQSQVVREEVATPFESFSDSQTL